MKVIRANATYTGGGIYIYTGQFDNHNFFQTSTGWETYVQELNTDPEQHWDENGDEMWQCDHLVDEHVEDTALDIMEMVFDWIIKNRPNGNYSMTDIIEAKDSLRKEQK